MSDTSKRHARRTVARHGQLPKANPVRQLLAMIGIALSVVLVAGIGLAAYVAYDLTSTFASDAVELDGQTEAPDIGELDNRGVNILLLGLDICEEQYEQVMGDRCKGKEYDEDGREPNANSDVMMLLNISPEPRRVTVVSFPRDIMTDLPVCTNEDGNEVGGGFGQLNSAYSYGGLNCAANAVGDLTGLKIDHAASITWGGVISMTSAIGGVTVCVGTPIDDPEAGAYFSAGEHTIEGAQALAFLRTRHGVGNGSDLGRISNQQIYLSALVNKLLSEDTLNDWGKLFSLARTAVENIEPSTGLTDPIYLARVALAVKDVPLEDFQFVQYPVFDWAQDRNRVIPDEENAAILMQALEQNLPIDPQAGVGSVSADGEPEPTEPPVEEAQPSAEQPQTEQPPATDAPAPDATEPVAPSNVFGQTAADARCSAGNAG